MVTAAGVWRSRAAPAAIVLVTVATVAFLPGALDRWDLPKAAVLAIGVLVAACAEPAGRFPRYVWALGVTAGVLLVVAAVAGANPMAQLVGRWPRYEGLVMLPVYAAAAWAGARLLGPGSSRASVRVFERTLAAVSVAVGLLALVESMGFRPLSSDLARPGSLLGNATDQGVVGLMLAALLAIPAVRPARGWSVGRVLMVAGAGSAALTVILSASRTAIAAFALLGVTAAIIAVATAPAGRRVVRAASFGATAIALLLLVAVIPLTRNRILGTSALAGGGFSDRTHIWTESWALLGDSPILGVGPSGFLDAASAVHDSDWYTTSGAGVTLDSPHNWALQAMIAGGIPLLIVAVALCAAIITAGTRARRALPGTAPRADLIVGAVVALVGYGIVLTTHFTAPATTILAAVLGGLLVAAPASKAHSAWVSRARGSLIVLWVVALLVSTAAEFPLRAGVDQASMFNASAADSSFHLAQSLRPWDADAASIAAQSFAASAEAGDAAAAVLATEWGRVALDRVPGSVLAAKALAVGQQYSGDAAAAASTLTALDARAPNDPEVAHRLGGVLFLLGEVDASRTALERAVVLDPDSSNAWLTLQFVCNQQADAVCVARAQAEIERVAALGE